MEAGVCELLLENTYFGPIVNVLHKKPYITEEAQNGVSQHLNQTHHMKNMVPAGRFRLDRGNLCRSDGGRLCIPLDMWSAVLSEAHDSLLPGGKQVAEKSVAAMAS